MARISLTLLLLVLVATPAARADAWQRPVGGAVLRAFDVGSDRYARGQHRGVDLGADEGTAVRSACSGRVRFAGRVPAGGLTVSVRCGAVVATYQQLGALAVRDHDRVGRGVRLGSVGRSSDPRTPRPHLHLGARELATGRYLDPMTLLRSGHRAVPWLVPPTRARPRAVPLGPGPNAPRPAPLRPRPVHTPALARPSDSAPGAPVAIPWFVWLGLLAFGLALPIGGLVTAGLQRRTARRRAAVQAG